MTVGLFAKADPDRRGDNSLGRVSFAYRGRHSNEVPLFFLLGRTPLFESVHAIYLNQVKVKEEMGVLGWLLLFLSLPAELVRVPLPRSSVIPFPREPH